MEHWFDRIAEGAHTRRTALRAATAGAAALALPWARPATAPARVQAACFDPCVKAAIAKDRADHRSKCVPLERVVQNSKGQIIYSGGDKYIKCSSKLLIKRQREFLKCAQPECGNPAIYPGGSSGGFIPDDSGGCPPGTAGCTTGPCCCGPGSSCCPCSASGGCICCVDAVQCSDCCPGG